MNLKMWTEKRRPFRPILYVIIVTYRLGSSDWTATHILRHLGSMDRAEPWHEFVDYTIYGQEHERIALHVVFKLHYHD